MIHLSDIGFVGSGLSRPECVLTHASGALFAADWDGAGGVAIVTPAGKVRRVSARPNGAKLRPNGVALEEGGTFLVTHLGSELGGLFRLFPDGRTEPVLTELEGRPLPPTNFVLRDGTGSLWITVSTRQVPRHRAARPDVADGFVVLLPADGAPRIVADGLGYTNECVLSVDGRFLYVNETFAKRLSSFELDGKGGLGPRQTVATFGAGTFPDGIAADAAGGLWITSIVSNRVIHVAPDRSMQTLLEDADPFMVAETETLFAEGRLGTERLGLAHGTLLSNVSSLAFGGPDLSTGYLGCLQGEAIATLAMPVAGVEPVHFRADLSRLAEAGLLEENA